MSSNLNLSSKKDSCVDERVLKCARGFRRGGGWRGWPLVICLYLGLHAFTLNPCEYGSTSLRA